MPPSLKPISRAGIPRALQKAERYRLLNDSSAAESICLDILAIDPANQDALRTLVLAITDQFRDGMGAALQRAREEVAKLESEYARDYYNGIICERRATAHLRSGAPAAAPVAAEWLREAMTWYEKAEALRPEGNDEAILRWNTCVRLLERHEPQGPPAKARYEPVLGD